ncbi:MAG TPA: hypothetical protein VHF26_18785 [Trebonia sp.]|nr:hypothetical protein [Trebonia sp.]
MGLRRRLGRNNEQPGDGSGRPRRPRDPQGRWLYRTVRGLRPDRNPLRRTTDRLETCLLAGLLVAAAAGAPFAAQAASHAAYLSALHTQQEQRATTHRVQAVLTQAATGVDGYSAAVPAQASWTSPTGVRRSGEVPAEPGSAAGTTVTVWTDGNGDLAGPPLTTSEVAGQADAAMAGAIAGVVAVFAASAGITRQVLYRRRMAAWEADWLATAPTWNRQRW